MDEGTVDFFNLPIWSYYDSYVSNKIAYLELFNTYSENRIGYQKLKIGVSTNSVNLDISTVYRLSKKIRSLIINKLNDHKAKITQNQKYTDGFSLEAKKNIYITYLWCSSSNSPCIRLMIGEKTQTILDSDKVYIPIVEFMSFYEMLEQVFANHVNSSFQNYIIYQLKFLNNKTEKSEIIQEKIINNVLSDETISKPKNKEPEVIDKIDLDSGEEKEIEVKESEKQNDFDSFLKNNRDSFELDIGDIKLTEELQKKTERSIEYHSKFVKDVLKNDFKNLEVLITNCVNSKLPFDSFVDSVKRNSGVDLVGGFNKKDINALNYIITRNIKHNVSLYLQKKIKLPNSTIPIVLDNNTKNDCDLTDIMYQLFISYIYLTKVRTLLKEKVTQDADNEDFFAYSLKTITSPIVFSFLMNVEREIFKNMIIKIYQNNHDDGFYTNFENKIKKYGVSIKNVLMTDKFIEEQALRIYDTANKIKDKLKIENFFNNKILVLSYKDFQNNDFSNEDIYQLCELDWCYILCGNKIDDKKLTISSYDKIPLDVLKKYGLNNQKHDNNILVRYISEKYPRFEDLEQIKKINNNVYDILDNINIMNYPENVLKALYFWDFNKLPKNINYVDFVKLIDNSSLTSNMLITMILDKTYEKDDSFYNSYLVSTI